jgi:hypothetical protein
MHYIDSEEHQEILNMLEEGNHLGLLDLLTPFCKICEMKISSAIDLEKHRLTANHLLAKE